MSYVTPAMSYVTLENARAEPPGIKDKTGEQRLRFFQIWLVSKLNKVVRHAA